MASNAKREPKDEQIIKKLSDLIKGGNKLKEGLYYEKSGYLHRNISYYQECARWRGTCINLLKLRFGTDSTYLKDFLSEIDNVSEREGGKFHRENVGQATGVLEYVLDALKSGLTEDLFYKKEILVFGELLEQAYEFLEKRLGLAAAIYGRIILETTVKEFAKKNGIDEKDFEQVIIKLRQKDTIQKPFETALRSNYQLGSMAAHGDKKFANYSNNSIREYLDFIRDKVLTL